MTSKDRLLEFLNHLQIGHGTRSVTDIHVNYDMRKVDAANKLVIDYVNRPIVRIMKRHKRNR